MAVRVPQRLGQRASARPQRWSGIGEAPASSANGKVRDPLQAAGMEPELLMGSNQPYFLGNSLCWLSCEGAMRAADLSLWGRLTLEAFLWACAEQKFSDLTNRVDMLETELVAMKLCKLKMEADKTQVEVHAKELEKALSALQAAANPDLAEVRAPPQCAALQLGCRVWRVHVGLFQQEIKKWQCM